MQVHDLKVVHRLKEGPQDRMRLRSPHLFYVDTCQRQLWITEENVSLATEHLGGAIYNGEAAYEKLLSVACGLESRVIGETEVYAQIRAAGRDQCGDSPVDELFTGLFEDTKYVRNNFLTGIGGQSYGTLIRKHLQPAEHSHFLIVGAGKLAASIIPMLADWRLTLSNRSLAKAESLAANAREQGVRVDVTETPANLQDITHSIICRPFDPKLDQQMLNLPGLTSFIHLGASADELASLSTPQQVYAASLNDVFSLQLAHDEVRLSQVAKARRACRERAQLRNLSPSICLPHGWEDLAAFSTF
jgi:glutamyl-tRNA reductase